MRQDLTYKYIKIFGVLLGVMLLLLLISGFVGNIRLKQILNKNPIEIGKQTEFGVISRIDSSSFSYAFNFSEGERVCFTVDTNLRKGLNLSVDNEGKIQDRITCD
jgi:hypothetical protein